MDPHPRVKQAMHLDKERCLFSLTMSKDIIFIDEECQQSLGSSIKDVESSMCYKYGDISLDMESGVTNALYIGYQGAQITSS